MNDLLLPSAFAGLAVVTYWVWTRVIPSLESAPRPAKLTALLTQGATLLALGVAAAASLGATDSARAAALRNLALKVGMVHYALLMGLLAFVTARSPRGNSSRPTAP